MKKLLLILSVLLSLHTFSQQKYQSLLWEISGNGLEKPSYIYGTMHVSKKVAFRLDDVFYEALNNSECIALESDPSTWLAFNYKNNKRNNRNSSYRRDFYGNLFKLKHPKEHEVRSSIRLDSRLISGYLYRKNYGSDNFEEETYLDMFIYQAGKKQKKPIVGLEDLAESRYLTTKARYSSNKRKPDPWLQKLFKRENAFLIQENTYRDRNLDLLDSISEATNTSFFREHMLFRRNENMVNVLDTLMHKTSVFSGVGAAHLPGDKGMINMLLERGYTVTPLLSSQTDYGRLEKEKLENLLVRPKLSSQSTPDKFITLKSFDTLREFSGGGQKYYLAPDMTNGAFLAITRISTYEYLPHKKSISLDKIDDLLYEDIPGTIVKKERISTPYPGISILNKTKKGDYQKYHIYKTPLEVVIVKFGGKKDYVRKYESEIFNSIQFKPLNSKFTSFSDPSEKYTFKIPENYITENVGHSGKVMVQGHVNDNYYFFQESPKHDVVYIEEDAFEAKYIHTAFYKGLEIEEEDGQFKNEDYKSYISSSIIDSTSQKRIWLKSVVKDGSYYLLGYSGNNMKDAEAFFGSFKVKTPKYEALKQVRDTSLYFRVHSPVKAPLSYNRYRSQRKKPYQKLSSLASYTSEANEKIFVSRTKFHDLQMFENIDSLWNSVTKKNKFTYASKNYKKLELFDQDKTSAEGYNILTHKLRDSSSNKIVLVKYMQKEGVLYKLSTLLDSVGKPSKFISTFYDTFKPLDTLLGENVFSDKSAKFFNALKQNDSIVLSGYKAIRFWEKHSPQIMECLEQHEFPKDKTMIKLHLLESLIEHDNSEQVDRYITELYTASYGEPDMQQTILNGLLKRKETSGYVLFLELLKKDQPLGSKVPHLYTFGKKAKDLQLMKPLFPSLLKQSNVADYKTPVYNLLTKLVDSNIVRTKGYKAYKAQILSDAKVQLKRSLGHNKRFSGSLSKLQSVDNYTKLLFPFRKERAVKLFYLRLLESEDWEALTTYYTLLKAEGEFIPNTLKDNTLFKAPAQHLLYTKLKQKELLGNEELEIIDLKTFARSRLFSNSDYKLPKDTIEFLTTEHFETDTGKAITMFVFKRITKRDNTDNEYLHFIAFEDGHTTKPYYVSKKNGTSIYGVQTPEELIEDTKHYLKHKIRARIKAL